MRRTATGLLLAVAGMGKRLKELALCGLLAVAFSNASAGVMTLDFNDVVSSAAAANFEYRGFRFSPEFHYHVQPDGIYTDAYTYLGLNPNYLGPDPDSFECDPNLFACTALYMDFHERPFALLSLIGPLGADRFVAVQSSKGGRVVLRGAPQLYDFSGPDWVGIKWVMFLVFDYIMPNGVDDIKVFAAPEPGTLALLSLGFAGLAFIRRRKQ